MSVDSVWEQGIYGEGKHLNRYPYDSVVSFVFRHAPRDRPRDQQWALDVGCGAGNNAWFLAREGFRVAGVEGSHSAVTFAKKRLASEGLDADLRVGDFVELPFERGQFDVAIDRGSITCCGHADAARAVAEVRRVLRPGGVFFFNPYSSEHTSASAGIAQSDGRRIDIDRGNLTGVGGIAFYDAERVTELTRGWEVLAKDHVRVVSFADDTVHAEWRIALRCPKE